MARDRLPDAKRRRSRHAATWQRGRHLRFELDDKHVGVAEARGAANAEVDDPLGVASECDAVVAERRDPATGAPRIGGVLLAVDEDAAGPNGIAVGLELDDDDVGLTEAAFGQEVSAKGERALVEAADDDAVAAVDGDAVPACVGIAGEVLAPYVTAFAVESGLSPYEGQAASQLRCPCSSLGGRPPRKDGNRA